MRDTDGRWLRGRWGSERSAIPEKWWTAVPMTERRDTDTGGDCIGEEGRKRGNRKWKKETWGWWMKTGRHKKWNKPGLCTVSPEWPQEPGVGDPFDPGGGTCGLHHPQEVVHQQNWGTYCISIFDVCSWFETGPVWYFCSGSLQPTVTLL